MTETKTTPTAEDYADLKLWFAGNKLDTHEGCNCGDCKYAWRIQETFEHCLKTAAGCTSVPEWMPIDCARKDKPIWGGHWINDKFFDVELIQWHPGISAFIFYKSPSYQVYPATVWQEVVLPQPPKDIDPAGEGV